MSLIKLSGIEPIFFPADSNEIALTVHIKEVITANISPK